MTADLLVVSGCTRDKARAHQYRLKQRDFADPERRAAREIDLSFAALPAKLMYRGEEHRRVLAAVEKLRREGLRVEHAILSAGYGLLHENQPIVPYDCSFDTMTAEEAADWAEHLGIAEAVRRRVEGIPAVAFVLYPAYRLAVGELPGQERRAVAWLNPDEDPLPALRDLLR